MTKGKPHDGGAFQVKGYTIVFVEYSIARMNGFVKRNLRKKGEEMPNALLADHLKWLEDWCDKKEKKEESYFFELVYMGIVCGKKRWHIDLMLERKGQRTLCVGDGDGDSADAALLKLLLLIKETGCPAK